MNVPTIPTNFTETPINPPKVFTPQHSTSKSHKKFKHRGLALLFIILTVAMVSLVWRTLAKPAGPTATTPSKAVAGSKVVDLNQTFYFDATNKQGKKLPEQIEFTIVSAEKTNQIILKGKRASAVAGRAFLIVNLKIKNSNDQSAIMNTRELTRLLPESLAPDIHNDPVEIQPISTKITRVGFAIFEDATNLQLQVGTISGEKTTIDLNL